MIKDQPNTPPSKFKILHCLRAVDGGLFRHVRDVAELQAARGHQVGVICDAGPYSDLEESRLQALKPHLSLGLHRFQIPRGVGRKDISVIAKTADIIDRTKPDIIHGHGAKGGLMARIGGAWAAHQQAARLYCPHGGSLWFDAQSLKGKIYFAVERFQERYTDALICVAHSSIATYRKKINDTSVPTEVLYNGLHPHELQPVRQVPQAADFLMIGALRHLKGVDVFLHALARTKRPNGDLATAVIVGSGPDQAEFEELADRLGLSRQVTFRPPMPARDAFMLAQINVVASRSESLPYIVLETLGAQMPLISTNVGGIPEIFGQFASQLIAPGNADEMARAMNERLAMTGQNALSQAKLLERIATHFTVAEMGNTLDQIYHRAWLHRQARFHKNTIESTVDSPVRP